jgi:hypothetical protein
MAMRCCATPRAKRQYAELAVRDADRVLEPVACKAEAAASRATCVQATSDTPWQAILGRRARRAGGPRRDGLARAPRQCRA